MSIVHRAPAFLLLGLVAVATGLLLAGYGVPVAIGVITGVLLGGAVMLAFIGLRPRSSGSWGYLSTHGGSAIEPDRELIERHGRDSMRVAGVDAGDLRRVIAVGSGVEVSGARVELIAVEIRADGGIATLVANTRPPVGYLGSFTEATVSDDAGTVYVTSGQGSGGSSPGTTRHEIRFAPAPPEGARTLVVRIDAFVEPFLRRAGELRGPWSFSVEL
jgi:hypothetical protein